MESQCVNLHVFVLIITLYAVLQCSYGPSNKVSNCIRRRVDNRKLLLICVLLLSHPFILFRFYFLSRYGYIPV
jgi:hypothetical protein